MNFAAGLKKRQGEFPMAPLIDVLFLLLIFFMSILVSAKWETKIDIAVPTASSGENKAREPGELIINLDKDGVVFINGREVTLEGLESLLQQVSATFKGNPIIIRADKETNYEHIIHVLDICRRTDVWNVSFATVPEEGTGAGL